MLIQRLTAFTIVTAFLIFSPFYGTQAKSGSLNKNGVEQYDPVVPNVIIVKFSENLQITENSINTQNQILNNYIKNSDIISLKWVFQNAIGNLKKSVSTDLSNIYLVDYTGEKSPHEMAAYVSSWPGVVYAEPKFYHYLYDVDVPNDTLYAIQSAYYEVIKAPQAWNEVKGEQGVALIAIVDGGMDIEHSDLNANIWHNQQEIEGIDGVDDDGNGFTDDYFGWNFANQSGDPTGLPETPFNADHGTHTAGIAAAVSNNITGVAGTSWNSTVMGINTSDESSDRVIEYGLEGIVYAADNGADIISCSWGRLGGYSYLGQDVVNYAASLGAIVIAAAGNNNSDLSHYPSSYNNVLSIAGTTNSDTKYWDSNYGQNVDLAAPAVNIYSTFNNDSYGYATGTSMSAPMVSGVAGLVKTIHPDWNGLQIGEQVRVTADSLPEEVGQLGRGRLNAFRAVTESSPSIRLVDYEIDDENENGTIEPGERINIYVTIQNYLEMATDVNLTLISSDPYVTIDQSEIGISSIDMMERIRAGSPFICDIATNAPSDYKIEFTLAIYTNEYKDVDYLSITVLPGYLNLTINNIKMTVTSNGRIVNSELFDAEDTVGFFYKFSDNLLYEGSLISGTSSSQISNAARVGSGTFDEDFVVTPAGMITRQIPATHSDEESFGQFVDQTAVNPMNIKVSQYTYAWTDSVYDDFIIMLFVIENLNETDLSDFYFGLFFDWDIDGENFDTNFIQYDSTRAMGYAYDTDAGPETHVGVVSLSDEEMNFEAIYNDDLGLFTDEKKWNSISNGVTVESAGPADVSFVIANGPLTLPAQSNYRLAFAMVGGDDYQRLTENADSATAMWDNLIILDIGSDETANLPLSFGLSQNYPNPFNPNTIINYELRITNDVQLNIYNVLGERVTSLVSEQQSAGTYSVEWNASGFASGIYYYELRTGNYREVKKMVLMK